MNSLKWTWVDWFIFTMRCGWYGTGLTYYFVNMDRLGVLPYTTFALFVTIGFIIPQVFWRSGYCNPKLYTLAEFIVTGAFSFLVNNMLGIYLSTSIILMPVLMIGYLMTKATARWAIPLFVIALPANRYWTMDNLFTFFIQYIDILLFFSFGLGFNIITKSQKKYKQLLIENKKQMEQIEQQNKVLEQYAHEIERLALTEERNRMARDLHDSIGHHFTSVTMGLDAIAFMVENHPQMAKEKVLQLSEVARTGLAEVRRTIHQIAPTDDHLMLTKQLENLILDFSSNTNTDIHYEWIGDEQIISPHINLTFKRCLQESITNAKRHGEATFIKVTMQFQKDTITLSIFNNGKPMDKGKPGFGLTSMKNRLQELNGSLKIKEQNGVEVICTLPIRRESIEAH